MQYINGSRYRDAQYVIEDMGFAVDSQEGYAIRILGSIGLIKGIRSHLLRSDLSVDARARWSDRAVYEGMKLGELIREAELKWKWETYALSSKRQKESAGRKKLGPERDISLARAFVALKSAIRKSGGLLSDTKIMEEIGRKANPPLKRRAAMNAVSRGLEIPCSFVLVRETRRKACKFPRQKIERRGDGRRPSSEERREART